MIKIKKSKIRQISKNHIMNILNEISTTGGQAYEAKYAFSKPNAKLNKPTQMMKN